ncbi:glutaminyl-peptide cyclotransferase [Streptomyces asiaticus]|uniref:glutaminyl-peptide cyclotransferase n=1 Tax=Streptomyces asiaticus TaxID=114695 RepID=UPI003F666D1B
MNEPVDEIKASYPNFSLMDVAEHSYKIVREIPHDTKSFNFTQGLAYENGTIYESTGLYGVSELRSIDIATGRVLRNFRLPRQYYGEGIAIHGDFIYQVTLREKCGFVYRKIDFALIKSFTYHTEGWGLTSNGVDMLMSDGSSRVYSIDPFTLSQRPFLDVTHAGQLISNINDLCLLGDRLYANIWYSDYILEIDPRSGDVLAKIDLGEILPQSAWRRPNGEAVLNGIACDPVSRHLFVTGKLWPTMFEIEIVEADDFH